MCCDFQIKWRNFELFQDLVNAHEPLVRMTRDFDVCIYFPGHLFPLSLKYHPFLTFP